jgi:hypothetical protein
MALAAHRMEAALLLTVLGWSLMWAQALSLVPVASPWLFIGCFFAGLAAIPLCDGPDRL